MSEPSEENKPVTEIVMGMVDTVEDGEQKIQIHYHPVDSKGEPIIQIENVSGPGYDQKGKPQPIPSSTGGIVDVKV